MSEEGDKDKKFPGGNETDNSAGPTNFMRRLVGSFRRKKSVDKTEKIVALDHKLDPDDSKHESEMLLKFAEIDDLKRENEELKGRAKRELNNLNVRLGEDIHRYKRAADKSIKKSDELIENLEAEKAKVSQLTKELEDSRGEIDRYKGNEVLLNSQLSEMKIELDSKSEEIERLEMEMMSPGMHHPPPPHYTSQLQRHSAIGAAASAAVAAELAPYPLVYVSHAGTISCVLNHDVAVEMAVDRSVRIVLHDNFAAFCNARGTSSAIVHPTARIRHTQEYVHAKFIANNEKMAVFDERGVLFTMSNLSEAYLVNSALRPEASAVALDQMQFPALDDDFTHNMFYAEAETGPQFITLCKDIMYAAEYERRSDGFLYLHINGMLISQSTTGDVIIDDGHRHFSCSPSKKSVRVRSGCVDMAVEEDKRGHVQREHKSVSFFRSGMAVSDGNCFTVMHHSGRIFCDL